MAQTMLKSLRVTADLDTAPYARGAAQKVAADKAMIDADKQLGVSMAAVDAQLAKMVPGLASLSKAFIPGYTEAAKFHARLDSLARVADKTTDLSRVATIYESIARSFNMMGNASELLAQKHVRLAPIVDQVNQKLLTQMEIAERASRSANAAANAQAYQSTLNSRLGVRSEFGGEARAADIQAYAAELDRIAAKYDATEAAMQGYRKELAELDNYLAKGAISQEAYAAAVDRTRQALQSAKGSSMVDQSGINSLLGVGGSGLSAKDSAAVFQADFAAIDRVNEALAEQARQTASVKTATDALRASLDPVVAINQRFEESLEKAKAALSLHKDVGLYREQLMSLERDRLAAVNSVSPMNDGLSTSSSNTRQRQQDMEAAIRDHERLAAAAAELKYSLDPVAEIMDRNAAASAEYNRMMQMGLLTQDQFNAAQVVLQGRLNRTREYVRHVGTGMRLSQHELANLSYQFNDMAVMLASGQAPFMMLMQQGMQVAQIIGPMGLEGGFRALGQGIMKFLTDPLNLAVIGIAAAAGAAAYFISQMGDGGRSIEETLKRQTALLSQMKETYAEIGRSVSGTSPVPQIVVEYSVRTDVKKMQEDLDKQLETFFSTYRPRLAGGRAVGNNFMNPEFKGFEEQFKDLRDQVKNGTADIGDFQKLIASIGTQVDQAKVDKLAMQILEASNNAALAQRQLDAMTRSLDPLATKLHDLFTNPRRLLGEEPNYTPLQSLIPDLRSKKQQLDETYTAFQRIAGSTADAERATYLYGQALASIQADLDKTRQLGDLEIKSIYARSPAEKASIAAQRERVSAINTAVDAEELNIRVLNASAQAYAEASFAIQEQNRQRMRAAKESLVSARAEVGLVGMTPAAQQEARANLQAMMDLRRQAEDNAIGFDQAQYDRLKAINAALAEQAQLLAERKLGFEISQERAGMMLSGKEQEVRQRLLSAGIDETSDAWERYAEQLREVQEIEASFGYGLVKALQDVEDQVGDFAGAAESLVSNAAQNMENAWVNFVKTGKISFREMVDSMIEDLGRLFYRMAMNGLLGMLGGGGGASGIVNTLFTGSAGLYANGAAFANGVEYFSKGSAFANSVVSRPTMFAYGAGNIGIMGEADPEAIMPLRRGKDGKLGVAASGGGGGVVITNTYHVDARGAQVGFEKQIMAELDKREQQQRRFMPNQIRKARQEAKI